MAEPPQHRMSRARALNAIRTIGATGQLYVERKGVQDDMEALGHDRESVCLLMAECRADELEWNGPDDQGRPDHIVKLDLPADDWPLRLYVKVAMPLPGLVRGKLLSFKIRN